MEEGCDYDIMLASQESPLFPSPNEKGKEEPISQNEMEPRECFDFLETFDGMVMPFFHGKANFVNDEKEDKPYGVDIPKNFAFLEELRKHYESRQENGQMRILKEDSLVELDRVHGFIWKLWRARPDNFSHDSNPDGGAGAANCAGAATRKIETSFATRKSQTVSSEARKSQAVAAGSVMKYGSKTDKKPRREWTGRLQISSKIVTSLSKGAVQCLLQFMYTGEMSGEPRYLLEILTGSGNLGLNETISRFAYEELRRATNVKYLNEMWSAVDKDARIDRETLTKLTIAFITMNPTEALNWRVGLQGLPRKVLSELRPSKLGNRIKELEKSGGSVSAAGMRVYSIPSKTPGESDLTYLQTVPLMVAEYLFMWGVEQCVQTSSDSNSQQKFDPSKLDNAVISQLELREVVGNLLEMVDYSRLSSAYMPDTSENVEMEDYTAFQHSRRYYFYLLLSNAFGDAATKQSAINVIQRNLFAKFYPQGTPAPSAGLLKRKLPIITSQATVASGQPKRTRSTGGAVYSQEGGGGKSLAVVVHGTQIQHPTNPVLELLAEEFNSSLTSDIAVYVDDGKRVIYAHSFMLRMWSTAFREYFLKETGSGQIGWSLPGLRFADAELFFKTFYVGYDARAVDYETNDTIVCLGLLFNCPAIVNSGIQKARLHPDPERCDRLIMQYEAECLVEDGHNAARYLSSIQRNLTRVVCTVAFKCIASYKTVMKTLNGDRTDEKGLMVGILSWMRMQQNLHKGYWSKDKIWNACKSRLRFHMLDKKSFIKLVAKEKIFEGEQLCIEAWKLADRESEEAK